MRHDVPGVLTGVDAETVPVVFDSPHSGTGIPPDFVTACDPSILRESEDLFVDELIGGAPRFGAGFLAAQFSRSYIDLNRADDDLDPDMLADIWPDPAAPTEKTRQGIGLIRTQYRPGFAVYDQPLTAADVRRRIDRYYRPYHNRLTGMLDLAYRRFGMAILIDCHSMPSRGAAPHGQSERQTDFVIGDLHGQTCDPSLSHLVVDTLRECGYAVRRNEPYSGAEIVRRHGRPAEHRHAVQVEINRGLYMNERRLQRIPAMAELKANMEILMGRICAAYAEGRDRVTA